LQRYELGLVQKDKAGCLLPDPIPLEGTGRNEQEDLT
jgi:hypothetical protein